MSRRSGWTGSAVLWAVTKCMCLPFLHAIKPSYAFFGSMLFVQTSLGLLLLALHLDKSFGPLPPLSLTVCLSPLASSCVTLIVYRAVWDKVWDVSLTIRHDPTRHSPSLSLSSVSWIYIMSKKMKMKTLEYTSALLLYLFRFAASVRVTPEDTDNTEHTHKNGVEVQDITEMDTNMPV